MAGRETAAARELVEVAAGKQHRTSAAIDVEIDHDRVPGMKVPAGERGRSDVQRHQDR